MERHFHAIGSTVASFHLNLSCRCEIYRGSAAHALSRWVVFVLYWLVVMETPLIASTAGEASNSAAGTLGLCFPRSPFEIFWLICLLRCSVVLGSRDNSLLVFVLSWRCLLYN